MIKSFKHKGLEDFYTKGSLKGIQPNHAQRLEVLLDRLNASISPKDMDLPGFRLHGLTGAGKGCWSVTVNKNWRITFYFEGHDAILVDYKDYH